MCLFINPFRYTNIYAADRFENIKAKIWKLFMNETQWLIFPESMTLILISIKQNNPTYPDPSTTKTGKGLITLKCSKIVSIT